MKEIIARVIAWNGKRYPQVYNHTLTVDLLYEELNELDSALSKVDKLDALIDIIYVSIGAIWKLGLDHQRIEEAIHIVCDANDSKSVAKTDPHIKANINKGPNFVPPEQRLLELLNDLNR